MIQILCSFESLPCWESITVVAIRKGHLKEWALVSIHVVQAVKIAVKYLKAFSRKLAIVGEYTS